MANRGGSAGGSASLAAAGWAVAGLAGAFLVLFFAWPVAAMVGRGLADGAAGLLGVLSAPRTWRIAGQTLAMALAGTAGSLILGIPGAYVLYRLAFPGRRVARAIVAVPFVLPTVVVGVAFRALLGPGGAYAALGIDKSVAAVVAAMVFFNYSIVVRTVGTMWASLDPRQAEAARTLGASPARAFLTVTLPALVPSIAAAGSLVFLFCSTAYGIVQTLGRPGYGTLETEIWVQTITYMDLPAAAGLSILQLAIVALAVAVQRRFAARSKAALRLGSARVRRPSRADIPTLAVVALTFAGLLLAPMAALAWRAFVRDGAPTLHNFRALATSGAGFAGGISPLEALGNSAGTAVVAASIALAVGLPLAVLLARAGKHGRLLDALVMAPLGVSSVTVGFGFFLTLQAPPLDLSGVGLLVPMAQAVIALPIVVRAVVPSLRAIDPRQREAAATLGAGPWRTLATIDGPFLVRALPLAFGFAFAISLGEFGATSFLASPQAPTLPVLIARLMSRPGVDNYGMTMAASFILALVTGSMMAVSEAAQARLEAPQRKGGRRGRNI